MGQKVLYKFILNGLFIHFVWGFSTVQGQQKYHNLVLEGGGIRGVAYCGALQELENRGMLHSIRRIGGTSAGAIQASLLSVGYSAAELTDLVSEMKVESFNDGQYIFVGGTQRLVERFGWYRGDAFRRWMGEKIEIRTGKANLTFGELHELAQRDSCLKDLYVTVTNLTQQKAMVLSHENFPHLAVADAVRASMSIPLYYCAVFMDSTGRFYSRPPRTIAADVLVDGGLLLNYPIGLFDQNRFLSQPSSQLAPDAYVFNAETLGLRLESAEQIKADAQSFGLAPYPIRSFKTYMGAFYNLVSEAANRASFRPEDLKRTISIDFQNIGVKVRKLSLQEKNTLIESGKKCVCDFCKPIPVTSEN